MPPLCFGGLCFQGVDILTLTDGLCCVNFRLLLLLGPSE
jgi:hypothetical protein